MVHLWYAVCRELFFILFLDFYNCYLLCFICRKKHNTFILWKHFTVTNFLFMSLFNCHKHFWHNWNNSRLQVASIWKNKKQRINQIPSAALSFLLLLNLWFGPWWVAPIIVTLLARENMLNPLWPRCYMTHMTWVRQEPAQPRLPVWPALLWSSLKNQSSRLSLRFSRSRTRVRCFSHRIKTAEHPPNFLSSTHFFFFF